MNYSKLILLFDGDCNLCNTSVKLILRHEKDNVITFSSLQSDFSKSLSEKYHFDINCTNSIILLNDDKIYMKSKAVFIICEHLKMPFAVVRYFSVFPTFVTDFVYDLIAYLRYPLFGKRNQCFFPDKLDKNRFVI